MTAAKIVPPKRDPRTGEPLTTGTTDRTPSAANPYPVPQPKGASCLTPLRRPSTC
jgi:hypothetical protein